MSKKRREEYEKKNKIWICDIALDNLRCMKEGTSLCDCGSTNISFSNGDESGSIYYKCKICETHRYHVDEMLDNIKKICTNDEWRRIKFAIRCELGLI